jgi:hypothetical protein
MTSSYLISLNERLIAETIPQDVFMEVKQLPMSWLSHDQHFNSLTTLTHPTVDDVLESYSQFPLCERTDSVPYENSDRKFAFFRYLASPNRSLISPYANSNISSNHTPKNTNTPSHHRRRPSDFNDLSIGNRTQRRTHAMYANAILGIAIFEQSPGSSAGTGGGGGSSTPSNSFQLTIFLFPGDRIIGKEKILILNSELEERMNKQLYRLRYQPWCDEKQLRKRIRKDVQKSGKIALQLLYTQRAWEQIYTPTPIPPTVSLAATSKTVVVNNPSDLDLFQALSFHSKIISLKFLNFLHASLLRLVAQPEDQHLFFGILQRVFGQRLTYLVMTSPSTRPPEEGDVRIRSEKEDQLEQQVPQEQQQEHYYEHYLITGPGPGQEVLSAPESGRYLVDIQILNRKFCDIRLIEYQGTSSGGGGPGHSKEEKFQQEKLVETLVDVVLYAVGVVCEDEMKLIVS